MTNDDNDKVDDGEIRFSNDNMLEKDEMGEKDDGNQSSAVHRGRQFEHDTLKALSAIGMTLRHQGGKSDGGVDIKGAWSALTPSVSVMVQCKNLKQGCQPEHLRGLVGATVGLGWREPILGILASASPKSFTADTLAYFGGAPYPLALARVQQGQLESLVLNPTAQDWLSLEIYPRFDPHGKPVFPPLLICKGRRIP
ncbi:hypothetical protein DM01DRAFT_1340459 [Hesseltinella vesiculosa]|uniref:Restriction endonuclease type IV Mrr domain-containing protein n=1 Tax=Hesseltinella vesiculosa TaxID=101127 RepID=A0A1X2G421_9FUNG|nr:hypothetical protein DM01DRAFT_1340459 [Hesseltinella vesiculosa]